MLATKILTRLCSYSNIDMYTVQFNLKIIKDWCVNVSFIQT